MRNWDISTLDVPHGGASCSVRLPLVAPAQRAILETLVAQILVGAVADRRGLDIEDFVFFHPDTKVEGGTPA